MIGRLPLNGWFHDRMIWLPTGMAVSVGANGALSTRIKSTSDRVSVSEMLPSLAPEAVSVSDRVSEIDWRVWTETVIVAVTEVFSYPLSPANVLVMVHVPLSEGSSMTIKCLKNPVADAIPLYPQRVAVLVTPSFSAEMVTLFSPSPSELSKVQVPSLFV